MQILAHLQRIKFQLVFGAAVILVAFSPIPLVKAEPKTLHIPIEAESFSFTPGVIQVNPGDRVILELTSTDVVHGLYLDGYDIEVTSDPGRPTQLGFTADKTGTYRFRCSVTCGALHPFMVGKIKVGNNLLMVRGIVIALLVAAAGVWGLRNEDQ